MAKRKFALVNFAESTADGYQPGDQAAHRAAAALADKADMPTISALSELLTTLERIGGQAYVTTFRNELEDGTFETLGFTIDYETRDARVVVMSPPDALGDVPVTDSNEPSTPIALAEPEAEAAENPEEGPATFEEAAKELEAEEAEAEAAAA